VTPVAGRPAQADPSAAEFLTFTWDGSEGSFSTQAEAKAAFLDALKKVGRGP